ncbi:uncharacterized protein LOC123527029 [Mercenaria mercenaria]|uniref:uncharacterized protein LOC123527029 n=1 Tax=Mercenaria mercenaria TaxID=6596 RepID=UPI00234E7950|nr:uncharacterized protein LOC123527029 [Mercenaria mercenaria]
MPFLDGITGIVFGAIVGSIFVITCIISAIKAIRDRSRIKKRRAVRKRNQLDYTVDGKNDLSVEDIQPSLASTSQKNKLQSAGSEKFSNGTSDHDGFKERLDQSVYSFDAGVDNLTFQQSNTNIKNADKNEGLLQHKSKAAAEFVPSPKSMVPKRAKSHDANFRRKRNLDHLPADCLAIKKSMRRHSYEIAVCENSWLAKDHCCFAPSKVILNAYSYGRNVGNNAKSSEVAFENEAFDKNDYRNT